jgi:predicted ABC-type ATPase
MSSTDKVKLFQMEHSRGYQTYLYYIATEDPAINISRVRYRDRVKNCSASEEMIISSYQCSLDFLKKAISFTNNAYIFDNSTLEPTWLATMTDGHLLEMKTDLAPSWFKKAFGSRFSIGNKETE